MRRSTLGVPAFVLAIAACNQAPAGDNASASSTAVPAANAAASSVPANGAAPSGNSSWGASGTEDDPNRGVDFIVFNRTGRTITGISLKVDEGPLDAGAQQPQWGTNILTQPDLPDGQRAAAHYQPDIEVCTWQIRATFEGGQARDYPTVNLCGTIRVDLR